MMKSNNENSIVKENKRKVINCGVIDRGWEYSSEPRLEGLLKQLKYIIKKKKFLIILQKFMILLDF